MVGRREGFRRLDPARPARRRPLSAVRVLPAAGPVGGQGRHRPGADGGRRSAREAPVVRARVRGPGGLRDPRGAVVGEERGPHGRRLALGPAWPPVEGGRGGLRGSVRILHTGVPRHDQALRGRGPRDRHEAGLRAHAARHVGRQRDEMGHRRAPRGRGGRRPTTPTRPSRSTCTCSRGLRPAISSSACGWAAMRPSREGRSCGRTR